MPDRILTPEDARQERERRMAREAAEAQRANPDAKPMTETVPGGEYILDDGKTHVNANGEPLK